MPFNGVESGASPVMGTIRWIIADTARRTGAGGGNVFAAVDKRRRATFLAGYERAILVMQPSSLASLA